jgi:hypothetical protein
VDFIILAIKDAKKKAAERRLDDDQRSKGVPLLQSETETLPIPDVAAYEDSPICRIL